MPKKILVVGQGIAGSILAYTLHRAGADITVADRLQLQSASSIAAGVINPITGKRYAKSWNFDIFYPFAFQFYTSLQQEIGQQIWFDYPIVRLLNSTIEQNEWSLRAGSTGYEGFGDVQTHAGDWNNIVQPGFAYGFVHRAARVHFSAIRAHVQALFQAQGRFLDQHIDPAQLADFLPHYDHIIFCEGYYAAQNPYFSALPWLSAKGDCLILRIPSPQPIQSILKKQVAIVPYGEGLYWAGANYYWQFEHTNPTPEGLAFNTDEVRQMLAVDVEVVQHLAAVRPVAKDRRPLLGWSAAQPKVGIFNGMGSKGALLTPYWAAHFAQHIIDGTQLDHTVDIRRFGSYSETV